MPLPRQAARSTYGSSRVDRSMPADVSAFLVGHGVSSSSATPHMSPFAVPHRAVAENHSELQCVDIWTPERLVVVAGYIPRLRSPMCTSSRWVIRNPVIPSVSTVDRGCDVTSVPFTKKRTWELPTSTASVFDDRP